MALLDVSGLSIAFGSNAVVSGLSFAIERSERFGIIGESGSGKTLTSLAIAGLLPEGAKVSGSIMLDETPLPASEKAMARLRGKRIGMVFQEPMTALNPLMRVSEQIAEAIDLNLSGPARSVVPNLLAEVGLEPRHGHRFPHQLSGGQRQRVMIAMALASQPDLLIADEPTSALDLITQRKVLDLIAEICSRRQMALLFISHDLKAVARLCTRVAVMHRGKLVETGPAAEVFASPKQAYTQKLVAASRFDLRPAKGRRLGETLLSVEGISRDYKQGGMLLWAEKPLRAVDDVGFEIARGECLALVGPSGCGKSTLARIVVGLDRATAGQMQLDGVRYHGSDLPKGLRRDLSLVFQDPFGSFNPRLSIGASLAEPLRLEAGLDSAAVKARLVEAVEAVGLDAGMLERYPHEFSGGQRQRLAIARALVTRPKLLVLDEPVSALDVSVRGEVLALLSRLQVEFSLTYLIISHDLDMVAAMADRVLVMEAGKIIEEGRPEQIFAAPQQKLTRDLMAARLPDIG
ncbi:MAG: ABC transporter ATP-binding protein [Candidatus Devosia phytovorans]|uniref:ABC transporter ATP-binding protein n=1 Tax=Candidatus Devosia phytovorans TaxID=3121372 RepID=A0AAJ6AY47_9HYPH|nr:ABC transporter ATP-binding protein [Devosia sp.]WEK03170.1 MAG: ABC transporter ATP-binding protein [Devosia sp.]